MLKIRALNREASSDEDAPGIRKEAQEEIVLDLYNTALRLQSTGELEEALETLQKLMRENIPQLEAQGGLPKTMSTIKYSCYVNIGSIYVELKNNHKALENYTTASELDHTDVSVWHKIGTLALQTDKYWTAAYAFGKGLECSESHWPCLDKLISVLYGIQETVSCLEYITKALVLDPYYIKGLVLRKSIYRNNPATEEYYKLYNPDHVLEPKVDVEITEEDEKRYLDEIEVLCNSIREYQRTLDPKPLSTIALPIPLEEFTWVALGKTITGLHRYLSDNNMTHLTKIDLKRCMSNKIPESKLDFADKIDCDAIESEKPEPMEAVDDGEKLNEEPEAIAESNGVLERRMSQISDIDQNETLTTPIQTDDNDEVEQDTEDQEESAPPKLEKARGMAKGQKRKRDLLSDLQIWGWHSKRKAPKTKKVDRDYTIEDALTRIIPSHLLPNGLKKSNKYSANEDSMSTMDLYNLHIRENEAVASMLSPIGSPVENVKSDQYFATETEREEVRKFWTRNWENCDAIDLIEEYVYSVAALWNLKWPDELVPIYIDAYSMFREHCSHPPLYGCDIPFEKLRKDALTSMLFGELVTYTNNKLYLDQPIHCTTVSHITLLSAWDVDWKSEYQTFATRVHWLRAMQFKRNGDNTLAISTLELVQELLQDENPSQLLLPNCAKYNVINVSNVEKILKNLELIHSLSRIEQLYEKQQYVEVAQIIKNTFTSSTNHTTYGRLGRHAQLGMLMHSLWFTDTTDCFVWTEECLNECMVQLFKLKSKDDKWYLLMEKCLLIMFEIIKSETVSVVDHLGKSKQIRLIECLTTLCGRQVNNDTKIPLTNVVPWFLLHYVLLRDEHRQQAKRVVKHVKKDADVLQPILEEEVPASIGVLFSAHEFLGPRGLCLVNQGELLHFMLDTIINRLDTPIFESLREKIDVHLEQAFFCLYQHPCKKNKISRHLADHNVNPLPLTWERAQQLCEFFCPDALPEFDSYKSISISADLEQLLQRVSAIVPEECDPLPLLPSVTDFINSKADSLPESIEFPMRTRAIYYLLGDYFFKQSEVKRSYKYFLMDLCINPKRVDTWAGLALGIHSQLESKLNHCERFKSEMEFTEKSKSGRICFSQALDLNPSHVTLWIEFGTFEYMVHSFCSRVLKYDSDTFSMEKFELLESEKESYLQGSQKCFQQALSLYRVDQGEADERWLYHYMLAKISEKRQEDPNSYLQHYLAAASLLHENKCTYPDKINYNNPQHLSLEALEVHYRMNASILKYLELHEGKVISASLGKLFKKCLDGSMIQKNRYDTKPQPKAEEIHEAPVQTAKPADDEGDKARDTVTAEISESDEQIQKDVEACLESVLISVEKQCGDPVDVDEEPKLRVRDVQDIMDEMMKETMEMSSREFRADSDMDTTPVSEVEIVKAAESDESKNDEAKADEEPLKQDDDAANKKSTEESSSASSSSSSSSESDSESEDSSSSSSSSSDNSNENLTEAEIMNLVDRCIVGLEHCIRRLPQNYKALYRLSHLYFSYFKKKDLSKCKQLFLGEYKCKNGVLVPGLFMERKANNFFNGIWRIPSSEIDRPGSLAAHMGRCVTLLLQVLRDTNDNKTLMDLCFQLKRVPDADKIYIRHSEREQLSEQALTMCLQSLRTQIKNLGSVSPAVAEKLLMDIYRAHVRASKNLQNEKTFAGMLVEVFKKIMGDKVSDSSNVLETATKYCHNIRVSEKLKKQQQLLQSPPKVPMMSGTPPVLPSPTNVGAPSQPLKRPSVGRPRGRPPGPKKALGSPRGPRASAPTPAPFAWPGQFAASNMGFDYLKQYQDELLRQYNQALSRNMNLLTATSTAASMMNPTNLVQAMQQMSAAGMNSLAANQLSQSLSQLNPSLLKKVSAQLTTSPANPLLANMTMEQMRQMIALTSPSRKRGPKPKLKPGKAGSNIPGFKYPPADISKLTSKDVNKAMSYSLPKDVPPLAHLTKPQLPAESTVNLIKDRPNISITPVTQTANAPPAKPSMISVSASPNKTLQEKLADKQKSQAAKSLEFRSSADPKPYNFSSLVAPGMPPIPKSLDVIPKSLDVIPKTLDVIPNYLLDSGLSISQVQKPPSASDSMSSVVKTTLPSSISMSVVKKPEEPKPVRKQSSDDDVIMID